MTYIVIHAKRQHNLGMRRRRSQCPVGERRQPAKDGREQVQPRNDGRGVDKGKVVGVVAGEELRVEEVGIVDVAEEGGMDAVVWREVVDRKGFEGHGSGGGWGRCLRGRRGWWWA